ncbi:SMI1/KNR4 family protein [Bacillus sp. A301a_S52]|nr:SMI1/KNR4 family protein [Bacillus sp. A301a_S52]
MAKWEKSLLEVEKVLSKFSIPLNKGVSEGDILILSENVEKRLGSGKLAVGYKDFLRKVNGLVFNGVNVYGVDEEFIQDNNDHIEGFIDNNEVWREEDDENRYLYYGDTDVAWFCYDMIDDIYVELDKPSVSLMREFDSFDDMLNTMLKLMV